MMGFIDYMKRTKKNTPFHGHSAPRTRAQSPPELQPKVSIWEIRAGWGGGAVLIIRKTVVGETHIHISF